MAVAALTLLAFADVAQARPNTFRDFEFRYLSSLRTRNTPVLFAQCGIPPHVLASDPGEVGKFVLFFPVGSVTATFAEFWWESGSGHPDPKWSNVADVQLVPKVELGEYGDGEIATYRVLSEYAKYLATQRFTFLRPDDFQTIAVSEPAVVCPVVEIPPRVQDESEEQGEKK